MSKRKSRSELDISDFHAVLTRLLNQYREAGYCPSCMGEALIKSGVSMVATTGTVCWPVDRPEEIELVIALAKLMAKRTVGSPEGALLQ